MWQRMMTLSIAVALAGATLAQQEKADEQGKPEAPKAATERDGVRATAGVRAVRAQEAAREAQEAAVREQDAAVQLQLERARAAERLPQGQRRAVTDVGPNLARRWIVLNTARATRREKVTYCGVSTAEPPPVLVEQLKLTRGIGLVVDYVEPGSPAEAAGLKQYDVITKMNDQILSNGEQLGVLVRLRKPNDDANFTVIRQGQTTKIDVELGQKEMEVEVENGGAGAPGGQARFFALGENGQLAIAPGMMGATTMNGGGGVALANINGNIQTVWSDDQTSLNLQIRNGKAATMIAKDKAGNEIFNGPIETPEQRKALPADLAEKLERAEGAMAQPMGARQAAGRTRVLTSTEGDTLLIARIEKGKATHVFAFNTTDGKTLFDGPTASDEERKTIPQAVAKQLEMLEKNQAAAPEFGVMGQH